MYELVNDFEHEINYSEIILSVVKFNQVDNVMMRKYIVICSCNRTLSQNSAYKKCFHT